ncbi:MAG: GAF domain-containing protein, partial [Thermomicrobiaceae bacterium]|nr:GAF domain-containing protein [Thermomicrobiaceae bacterium]
MTAPVAYRWAVGIAGLVALAALLPGARVSAWLDWALLVVLIAVAHILLTIPLKSRRLVSFSSAFMFVVFLRYGAVPAALAQFVGLLAAQIAARQVRTSLPPAPRLFIVFNLGQLTLCALLGGLASALLGEHGFWDAPSDRTAAIVTFAGVYLAANVALTTGAIYLSHGWQHVLTQLWPQTSLWTAISFVYSVPLALETVSLGNAIGLLFSSLVIFVVLAVISWIARLNVRLGAQNRELARINLELSAINEAGRVLAAQNDLASLWPTVHEQVGRVVPGDAFFIATIDEERGRVTYQWVAAGSGGAPGPEGPIEGLVATVARSRRPVIAATPEEVAALGHGAVFPGRFAPASLIAAPLVVGERVVGVISAQSAHPEAYQPRHLSLFEALAGQTSVALENARLVAQLRVALRDREEYLSVVSHELKNPIASIRAYAQLASRRAGAHEDERVLQALARIAAQTDRLNRLVDDLLALSRIDTGRFEIAPSEIDLQAILREAVEAAQATYTRHRLSLTLPAGEQ